MSEIRDLSVNDRQLSHLEDDDITTQSCSYFKVSRLRFNWNIEREVLKIEAFSEEEEPGIVITKDQGDKLTFILNNMHTVI